MDTHFSSWSSYVIFNYFFIFSNFEPFCVCFDIRFWLLYLICECVEFFNLTITRKKKIGIEELFCLSLYQDNNQFLV